MVRTIAAGAALLLAACNTNFAPQYLVRDLRILAVNVVVVGSVNRTADPFPGDTLRFTALVANPDRLTGVTVRWKACLPVDGQSVSPCEDTSLLGDPSQLSGPGVVDLGEGTDIQVPVPAELAPFLQAAVANAAQQPSLACTLYVEVPVVAIATAPGARTRAAVKPARVVPPRSGAPSDGAYARNRNPSLTAIRGRPDDPDGCSGGAIVAQPCANAFDCDSGAACSSATPGTASLPGQCADAMSAGLQVLCARAADTSVQIYNQCAPDGSRQPFFESLDYQWYATGGVFQDASGGSLGANGNVTGEQVTFTPPAGPFTLWVIIRDGRGGEDWIERDFP